MPVSPFSIEFQATQNCTHTLYTCNTPLLFLFCFSSVRIGIVFFFDGFGFFKFGFGFILKRSQGKLFEGGKKKHN